MTNSSTNSIAIIGMACVFPGAHSPEELWQNVLAGRRSFRKAPPERIPKEYFDPDPNVPGKSYNNAQQVGDCIRVPMAACRIVKTHF
ncbi:MAG: beta-ketoacyl synthase N-terminal-like domain-containing protein [Candidatus Anammoxibacter sp.]